MSLVKQSYKYFKYKLRSATKYDIHSPFVFDLVTKVINDKTKYDCYATIENLRAQLLRDEREINVLDLGAGSKLQSNNKRKVKDICRTAEKNKKYAQLLFRLVKEFQPETIIDLGTSLGLTTLYLSEGNSTAKITTIEGCSETSALAKENFAKYNAKNIELVTGNFDDKLLEVLNRNVKPQTSNVKLDFVFFDGNHRKIPTLNYFNLCLNYSHNDSVFVFDDINWSDEMAEAWDEIKKHPSVTVSVDLFFLGIVFFRKEQVRQHFLIDF